MLLTDVIQKKQWKLRNANPRRSIKNRSCYGWAVASLQDKVQEADQGSHIHLWDYLLMVSVWQTAPGSLTSTVLCTSVAGRCGKWEFDDCPKCYDDIGVPNCKLISFRVWHCMWQQIAWSSSEQTSFQVHLDMSSYRPHHRPRPTVEESQLPGELLVGYRITASNAMLLANTFHSLSGQC